MDTDEKKPMQLAQNRNVAEAYQNFSARTQTGVKKTFTFTQMYFFALSLVASWEAMATNFGLIFWNGGPRAMVWAFLIVVPGVLAQVASLAEMASAQPIAGAQYHWTWHYAPPNCRRGLAWLSGWITWSSYIASLAGLANIAANITITIATANYPTYVWRGWHTILIMYAYLIVLGLFNMYAFWLLPWLELLAGLLHIVLWIVFAVVLLTLAERHTNEFVWWEKANMSGWNDDFVSFNLGTILLIWGFIGLEAIAHISEETKKAKSAIPRAMFWSVCMNAGMAFGMVLIFLYTCGDVKTVANATYPLMDIILAATKSLVGASVLMGSFLLTVVSCITGSIASNSRKTWAWSRDGALPAFFAYVDPKHCIPVRAVWLPIFLVMLLSLLNLASYTAFSVIISLSTFGMYQSYFIAIACVLHSRLTGRYEEAPWSLGRLGAAINIVALVFTAWLGIFMVFPMYLPVTTTTMNYALPINAFVWLFTATLWFAWARKNWPGLNVEVIDSVIADGDHDMSE